jgi:GH24 family phage-related lysozyme (muramidase)
MSNTNRYDALHYLDFVIGIDKAKELFTFYVEPEEDEEDEEDDNYKEKEVEYKDPNQLSLFEARKQVRLIMEQKVMPKYYLKEAVNLLREAEEKSPTYQWDFVRDDEKSPTYQWDLTDKESGVKDDISPTYQWDLNQDNPTLDSYEKAKEYIDKALSYIKDKASAIEFVRDLKDYIGELSTSAKLKLTKYVATALLGIIGFGGMTSLLSNSASEVEREVVKTIVANKDSKDKTASDTQNIKSYPISSSEELVAHLKASEGYNATFYDLKDGAYTVGWGHAVFRDTSRGSTGGDYSFVPKFNQITPDVTMLLSAEDMKSLKGLNDSEKKQKMSELAELNADQLLRDDIKKAEEKLNAILSDWESQGIEVKIDQDMYDAMISMIFNMGAGEKFRTSDFLQSVKKGDLEGAYNAIDKIDNPKLLTKYPGLRDRREKEKAMFGSSLASANQKDNTNDVSEIRKIIKQIINEII